MKPDVKRARAASADAEKQLKSFIDKFEPKNQALIRGLRKVLRKRFPTANELVWDNYNFFVIGYSATERPSDSIVSIAATANGVGWPSTGELLFPIRTRYCSAQVAKIVSSACGPRECCRVLRLKRSSLRRLPRPRRLWRRAAAEGSSSDQFRRSRNLAANQPGERTK